MSFIPGKLYQLTRKSKASKTYGIPLYSTVKDIENFFHKYPKYSFYNTNDFKAVFIKPSPHFGDSIFLFGKSFTTLKDSYWRYKELC